MSNLTGKEEEACKQYINTGSKSEALRLAYNYSKMKPTTLHVKASQFFNKAKIRIRITELQEESKKVFMVSAEQKRRMLWELALACADTDEESQKIKNPTAAISAIAEMNKMDGDLASIKIDADVNNRTTVVIKDMTGKKAKTA
jgi:phage terminase small subunit